MPTRRLAFGLLAAVIATAAGALPAGAGAGAAAPHAAAAASAPRTYAVDPLTRKLKVRPRRLAFRDVEITDLQWRRWGRKVTRARGISRILTCNPNCASGGAETTATTVWLSRPRVRGGKRRYTCMTWQDDEKVSDLPDHNSLNPDNFRPCPAPPVARRAAVARAAGRCRGIDLGYTTARVTASNVSCRRARFVILEWKRKVGRRGGPPPRVVKALGYRCRMSGTDRLITLRCTRGDRLAKATWGG